LSKLYAQDVNREQILKLLDPIIKRYAKERDAGEHFGNFVVRAGIVNATTAGNNFHDNIVLAKV
jgi:sulfite reductase (NADPH) hemoprotein beta-component